MFRPRGVSAAGEQGATPSRAVRDDRRLDVAGSRTKNPAPAAPRG